MTIKYDNDTNCDVYTCGVCGYIYRKYYDYDKQVANKEEEPFIKLEEPVLRVVHNSWGPDGIERLYQYVCPICGTIQIDTKVL